MPVRTIVPKSPASLKPAKSVEEINNPYIQQAIQDLLDTLAAEQKRLDEIYPELGAGVGLASNQIDYPYQPTSETDDLPAEGYYPKDFPPPSMYVVSVRLVRAQREGCEEVPPTVYINARYEALDDEAIEQHAEGCLSITGIQGLNVPRQKIIQVYAQNSDGESISFEARGFIARVHQHEQDHGNGEEYLNHLKFSTEDLENIRQWVMEHRLGPTPEKGSTIIDNLMCTGDVVDYDVLLAWVDGEEERLQQDNTFDQIFTA